MGVLCPSCQYASPARRSHNTYALHLQPEVTLPLGLEDKSDQALLLRRLALILLYRRNITTPRLRLLLFILLHLLEHLLRHRFKVDLLHPFLALRASHRHMPELVRFEAKAATRRHIVDAAHAVDEEDTLCVLLGESLLLAPGVADRSGGLTELAVDDQRIRTG